ncbi:MAG: DUF2911 domain-containing protein, partial [Bacteroidota bacterium]
FLLLATAALSAQEESRWPDLDASNLDVAYFPQKAAWTNYLPEEERGIRPEMKILYSRPKMNGRKIFGDLVPYGEEWRLGANEATLITFYNPVDINGTMVGPGVYSVFATPTESEWTVTFSSQTNIWGGANRDMEKNVASITVPAVSLPKPREEFGITFQEIDGYTTHMVMEWETTRAAVPIKNNPINYRPIDASPLDLAHYPAKSAYTNYLEGDEAKITPKVQVTYSRPAKKGRDIFGELLKNVKVWRLGANEATEISFFENVKMGDIDIARGRYAMFAALNGDTWDIILSKDFPIWGAANRDEEKDVARIEVPVQSIDEVVENFSIIFEEKSPTLAHMVIAWDQTMVEVPITFE